MAPVSPLGIVKSNVAALDEPLLLTDALDPALPVLVEPTAIVAAVPVAPVSPLSPVLAKVIITSSLALNEVEPET